MPPFLRYGNDSSIDLPRPAHQKDDDSPVDPRSGQMINTISFLFLGTVNLETRTTQAVFQMSTLWDQPVSMMISGALYNSGCIHSCL
jgi:hypothetical protein